MYECPNCAGNLKFDIPRQQLYCEHCDTTVDPYSFFKEKDAEETVVSSADIGAEAPDGKEIKEKTWKRKEEEKYEVTVFTCPQCGGQIVSEDTTAATFCSFCGAATILDSRISKERRPGYIIPFTKTKEDCRKAYKKMMRRAVFAPKELKDADQIEKFRGIYMPYWVYSFERKGRTHFAGSRSHRRGDYRITKHYQLDCEIDEEYKGLAYDASASFSDNLSGAIAPFDLKQGKPFVPSFLSGFYADTSDVDRYVYKSDAEDIVVSDGCRRLGANSVCRRYNVGDYSLKNAVCPNESSVELAMLPVWFLSCRNGDRISYAVVNGQTGKVAADLPVDIKKYLTGSLLLAIPLFILLNLFLTITPTRILLIAALLAFVCVLISNVQISNILAREAGEDDKGLASVQPLPKADIAEAIAEGRKQQQQKRSRGSSSAYRILGVIVLLTCAMALLPTVVMPLMIELMMRGISADIGYSAIPIITGMLVIFAFIMIIHRLARMMDRKAERIAKKENRYRGHFKEKLPTLAKPLAGIVTAVFILIKNPVSDWFYYIGAFVCMGTVLWAILDIIRHHNLLSTRKLPQFNRRGGDERA